MTVPENDDNSRAAQAWRNLDLADEYSEGASAMALIGGWTEWESEELHYLAFVEVFNELYGIDIDDP